MASSITWDPYSIMKQAGVMENATSNAAGLRRDRVYVSGVNEVFTAEVTGHNG